MSIPEWKALPPDVTYGILARLFDAAHDLLLWDLGVSHLYINHDPGDEDRS